MNSNTMSGQEFYHNLSIMPLQARIHFLKAIELYFAETQLDELDLYKFQEWMATTPREQIEAQSLSTEMRRKLAALDDGKRQQAH